MVFERAGRFKTGPTGMMALQLVKIIANGFIKSAQNTLTRSGSVRHLSYAMSMAVQHAQVPVSCCQYGQNGKVASAQLASCHHTGD